MGNNPSEWCKDPDPGENYETVADGTLEDLDKNSILQKDTFLKNV